MPPSPSANKSSMSFMPKGSSLTRNIRRATEDKIPENHPLDNRNYIPQHEDFNDSTSSDGGSKYSYEDSGDEMEQEYYEKNIHGSIVSPAHSAYESPDALDINTLVQLNSKLPPGRDISSKTSPLHSLNDKGGPPPSLNLRKMGQPTSLKPIQPATKKKSSPKKRSKNLKSLKVPKYDTDESGLATEIEEEQKLMLERIQKEWATMQEEFKKEEKARYDQMVKESSERLKEEEALIQKEHSDMLSTLKAELEKKIHEERNTAEKSLTELKKNNEDLYYKEEQVFKEKLDALNEMKSSEISKIKQEHEEKLMEMKKLINVEKEKEIEAVKLSQIKELNDLKESHLKELALVEKAHSEKINDISIVHTKELSEAQNNVTESKSSENANLLLDIEKTVKLLEEKKKEFANLSEEFKKLENEINTGNQTFLKLEEKISSAQTYFEEIQNEVDETENNLDLLRTEKSALITEISILKENTASEKSKLQNIAKERETKLTNAKTLGRNCIDKSVNTEVIITTACQYIQTSVDYKDAFCQIIEEKSLKEDRTSQTNNLKSMLCDKFCQVDFVDNLKLNNKNISPTKLSSSEISDAASVNVLINKSLENALANVTHKIDERFKVIEKHIGSLAQIAKPPDNQIPSSDNFHNSSFAHNTENPSASNIYNLNVPQRTSFSDMLVDTSYRPPSVIQNKNTCSCVQGDAESCDVMQEVKNSIYRLNGILSQTFMPALNNSDVMTEMNHPVVNYSSPLESFYSQFRHLQEKHRITNLKHKCQNEIKLQVKNSSTALSGPSHLMGLFKSKDYSKPNNIENSNLYSIDYPEDPLMRARNLVLKEKARYWKQSQLQNSLVASSDHHFSTSDNLSHSASSRTSPALGEKSPYLNFESDPEADYNAWMSRLNALQQRIRSHKFS
nr:uncharacterized protein LOC110282037 isoform X1 [Parasteatoda tepidariorum]XP_042902452.1 uncharacterized protein LOC110282037 isoform X1 [Parasteatoda tepidariorum]